VKPTARHLPDHRQKSAIVAELNPPAVVMADSPWRREGMNRIVEAVVKKGDLRVPVGLISVKQALDLPAAEGFEFSHPAYEAGKTDIFVSRDMLSKLK
jgi:hypothetical protein